MLPKELTDKYRSLKLLHHGIGGEVWLVEHKALACRRILKTVKKEHPQYGSLIREAKLLQRFHHSSIPIIYDILEYDTATYLIEEFIEGETLKQYFLRQQSLSESLLLTYSVQLCEILNYIHSPAHKVLHLDLKPENILISDGQMKLIDFGSAIYQNQGEPIGVFFGSPGFYAPEQAAAGILSEQTDLYGLGRVMEYMLLYAKKSPKGFLRIVQNCLRTGKKTYTSAEQVCKDLCKISHGRHRVESGAAGKWYAVTGVPTDYHSTLMAAALAAYLRGKRRKSVLFISCNPGGVLEERKKPRAETAQGEGFVYEWNGVTIAERIAVEEVKGWRGRGYDYIICDFGTCPPSAAGIPFDFCIAAGLAAEWTLDGWRQTLDSFLPSQKAVVAVTEGDSELAAIEFGTAWNIGKISLLCPAFTCSRSSKKFFRNLL